MLSGSANPLNVFLIPPNYDIIRKYNMAAKIAAVLGITLIRVYSKAILARQP